MKNKIGLLILLCSTTIFASNTPTVFTSNVLQIGDGSASTNKQFKVKMNGSTPFLQYDHTASQWVFSNDGSTTTPIGAGSGGATNVVGSVGSPQLVTAGSGVSITGQIINGPNMVFIAGNGGPVTVTATPSMTACTAAGEFVTLVGVGGSNAVTLQPDSILSGSKLFMPNSFSLADGGSAQFVCDASSGNWRLTSMVQSFITATGGTVTTDGNFKIHTFTTSGTFAVTSGSTGTAEVMVIAGGGGGGINAAGGGGAGGLIDNVNVALVPGNYTVTVGTGGIGGATGGSGTVGGNGTNSIFQGLTTCVGGGGGGSANGSGPAGLSGGSGGGTYYNDHNPGAGTGGQGFAGGAQGDVFAGCGGAVSSGSGGGGATAAGHSGCVDAPLGLGGGPGYTSSISGASICYAGGGGGGAASTTINPGQCGGGTGGYNSVPTGQNGTAATGGGGGGSTNGSFAGGNGGAGVVIVRYRFQ